MTSLGVVLLAFALLTPSAAFLSTGDGVSTHVSITKEAVLQKVTETCQDTANDAGGVFNSTGTSPEELAQACLGPKASEVSGAKFQLALQDIYNQHELVDQEFNNSPPHHFNSEAFSEGRSLITEGMAAIKDFYSHSNWVELGYTEPYANLLLQHLPLENLADVNTATCRDCASGTCSYQILPNILKEKKLTSGYMGVFSAAKPNGLI